MDTQKDQRAEGTKKTHRCFIGLPCQIKWPFLRDAATWAGALAADFRSSFSTWQPKQGERMLTCSLGGAELFVRFYPGLAWHGRAREGKRSLISGYSILGFLVVLYM